MAEVTEEILKRFDYKPASPVKVPINLNLSYKMADESLIDLREYRESRRLSRNFTDSDYTPSPIKRERPPAKQQQSFPPPPPATTATRLPSILPKKLFTSPTKNYSAHVAQERSGPSSPQKRSLGVETSNEEIRSLKLEIRKLRTEHNSKTESLTHRLGLITKERDEVLKENLELDSAKMRLQAQNDLLQLENDTLVREKYNHQTVLKGKDKQIVSLEDKVDELGRFSKQMIDKNAKFSKDNEVLQVKLKKYVALYRECREKHGDVYNKEKIDILEEESAPEEEAEPEQPEKVLQPENQEMMQALTQALKNLTEAIDKQSNRPDNELHDLVTIMKDFVASNPTEPPLPQSAVAAPVSQCSAQPFSQCTTQPAGHSTSQTISQPSGPEAPPPQRSQVPANPQPVPTDTARPAVQPRDVPSPGSEVPQDLHNDNPLELYLQPREWTRAQDRKRSTSPSARLDVEVIKELLKTLVDEVKGGASKEVEPEPEVEESEEVPECTCACGRCHTTTTKHPSLCPVCLNNEDFTSSELMNKRKD
ncbi:hypothetical protein Cantr_03720 [Candida viswanathii]|uniref:Uncharacterized protein n=1 Tax=Candida viswanathii TaxID=5486 RepID=A0A367XMD1_9ASCO|nr:hypothetical protein Cantr_03720 [Candida viswanathii]